jgi:hypothetical protein
MTHYLTFLLAAIQLHADPKDAQILGAIGAVESGMNYAALGDHRNARGAFQLHRDAWVTACKHAGLDIPWSSWRSPKAQDAVAFAYFAFLKARFAGEGINTPTPEQMALAWNLGFDGAKRIGFNPANTSPAHRDAAERVGNLCK